MLKLNQLDLNSGTVAEPNVIGNQIENEQVLLVNLNTTTVGAKAKKNNGHSVYNFEVRTDVPKMPRLSQKHE